MGFMNWLFSSRLPTAREQIQQGLQIMKSQGLFDADPAKGAQAVEDFSASRFSKTVTDNMNSTILAASWLVVFVRASRAPREQLLPFVNLGFTFVRVATAPKSKLNSWEESTIQRVLEELSAFVNASPINLDPPARRPQREVIPIDGASSMFCILAERDYLDTRYGVDGWQLISQASIEEDERFYDKLTIKLTKGGETTIWFDLTASKAKWTDEGNVEALRQFQQDLSKVVNGGRIDAAKKIIVDCLDALNYSTERHDFDAYLPVEETVEELKNHASKENLTPEELALLLIDAGFVDHNAALKIFESKFIAANYPTLGERAKDAAQSARAEKLERHDRLLMEVFKRAVEKGTLIVPQYGSVGTAMKKSLGELIEPFGGNKR